VTDRSGLLVRNLLNTTSKGEEGGERAEGEAGKGGDALEGGGGKGKGKGKGKEGTKDGEGSGEKKENEEDGDGDAEMDVGKGVGVGGEEDALGVAGSGYFRPGEFDGFVRFASRL